MKFNKGDEVIVTIGSFDNISATIVKYSEVFGQWVVKMEDTIDDCLVGDSMVRRNDAFIIGLIDELVMV